MTKGIFEGWCVLRTKSRHTLRLAETLSEDGFDVWTPIETRTVRVPRMNARRELRLPIMPSYIFAKAHHLIDLLMLADMSVKPRRGGGLHKAGDDEFKPPHEDFRVMRCPNGIPAVSDADLKHLRNTEAKRTPIKRAADAIATGVSVRVVGGSFGGLEGIVKRGDRKHTLVCFAGRHMVKIPTCILKENVAGAGEPDIGIAA